MPVLEVLGHCALHRLPTLLLQGEPREAKGGLRPLGPKAPRIPGDAFAGLQEVQGEVRGKRAKPLPGAETKHVLWVTWNVPQSLTFHLTSAVGKEKIPTRLQRAVTTNTALQLHCMQDAGHMKMPLERKARVPAQRT